MTRALILNAVSTPEQAKRTSLDFQNRAARELCSERGWQIVDALYSDTSRSEHDRIEDIAAENEAFDKLWRYIDNRAFDWLVIHSFDRLNRDPALITFLIQRIIRSGARIWSITGGEVNKQNYVSTCASILMMVSLPMQINLEKTRARKLELMQRGLPQGSPPWFMQIERSESGRRLRMTVRPEAREHLTCAALCLLDDPDLNYQSWELITAQRYQIKQYRKYLFYETFFHPAFWGHIADGFSHNGGTKTRSEHGSPWCFDPAYAPPAGATMFWNVLEPVLAGELAELVQDELLRRYELYKGRHVGGKRRMFSGLCICGSCGARMSVVSSPRAGKKYVSYRCQSKPRGLPCASKARQISTTKLKATLDQRLREVVAAQDIGLISASASPEAAINLEALSKRRQRLDAELTGLLRDKATAPEDLQSRYATLISDAASALRKIDQDISTAQIQAARRDHEDRDRLNALRELTELSVDKLWSLPHNAINQLLLRLFGRYRLVIEEAAVIGIAPAPTNAML